MFLLIDNYDSFTYNLVHAFSALGEQPEIVYNDDPHLLELASDPRLEKVCISPGPGRPENAGLCPEFLRRLNPAIPVLGICLGHQLLGLHAGAPVVVNKEILHGKASEIRHDGKGLFTGIANPMRAGRYHSLVVDVPEGTEHPLLTVTARGPQGEVMALQYKDCPWVGVQFHPESILTPEGLHLLGNFPHTVLAPEQQISMPLILETLARRKDLTADMAAAAFARLMDGKMDTGEAGAFLMGLRAKGESPEELAQAVKAVLARAVRIRPGAAGGKQNTGASAFNKTETDGAGSAVNGAARKGGNFAVGSGSSVADAAISGRTSTSDAAARNGRENTSSNESDQYNGKNFSTTNRPLFCGTSAADGAARNEGASVAAAFGASAAASAGERIFAIDVVGTGGDGKHSFNCSTATALTLAGMGYTVIKHGNRAVSSTSGSADALEALGIPFGKTPEEVLEQARKRHFAFIFAQYFHPAFRYVAPVRKALGIRTLFNLLGPMVNPACPSHLLMGVASPELVPLMARTLTLTDVRRAAVVCGAGGYDELTPIGPATVMIMDHGNTSRLEVNPAEYGIPSCTQEDLAVHTKEEAAAVLRELLSGNGPEPMRHMLTLNVGLGIALLEKQLPLAECMARARDAVLHGAAGKVLHAA